MKAREFMTKINEGVKRNALYQKVGRMLGKGHNIDAIKKRYKDIDDAYPGHIEKIVQALKDRNEIPFKEDESISEIDHMRKLAGVMSQTPKAKKKREHPLCKRTSKTQKFFFKKL